MTYLKGLLKGDAASCILGFKITNKNYETLVILLKEKLLNLNSIIDVKRFSSYLKLLRVTSYVMHFINRLTNNLKNNILDLHLVDSVKLKQAEILWIRTVHHDVYNWKQFKQLNADLRFFIEGDILQCKGRIGNASLSHMIRKIQFIYQSVIFLNV